APEEAPPAAPAPAPWAAVRGALVGLHVAAVTLLAVPAPQDADRGSWQNPKVQAELTAWADRLTGWGWEVTPARLEEELLAIADGYLRVRARLPAPFDA